MLQTAKREAIAAIAARAPLGKPPLPPPPWWQVRFAGDLAGYLATEAGEEGGEGEAEKEGDHEGDKEGDKQKDDNEASAEEREALAVYEAAQAEHKGRSTEAKQVWEAAERAACEQMARETKKRGPLGSDTDGWRDWLDSGLAWITSTLPPNDSLPPDDALPTPPALPAHPPAADAASPIGRRPGQVRRRKIGSLKERAEATGDVHAAPSATPSAKRRPERMLRTAADNGSAQDGADAGAMDVDLLAPRTAPKRPKGRAVGAPAATPKPAALASTAFTAALSASTISSALSASTFASLAVASTALASTAEPTTVAPTLAASTIASPIASTSLASLFATTAEPTTVAPTAFAASTIASPIASTALASLFASAAEPTTVAPTAFAAALTAASALAAPVATTPAPKTGGRPRHAVPTDSALQKREYRKRKAIRGALMGAAAAIVAAAAVAESF
jgi:hypothetical protein